MHLHVDVIFMFMASPCGGHRLVHAAARHDAQRLTRGTLQEKARSGRNGLSAVLAMPAFVLQLVIAAEMYAHSSSYSKCLTVTTNIDWRSS